MASKKVKRFVMRIARRTVSEWESRATLRRARKRTTRGAAVMEGTLADSAARLHAIAAIIDATDTHYVADRYNRSRGLPGLRHFLGTFCVDDGLVEGETISPRQIASLKGKIYRAVRDMDLHGICFLQIVAIRDPRAKRWLLWLHAHGILWTGKNGFKPVATAKLASDKRAYRNHLGAPSIDLRSRRKSGKLFRGKNSAFYKFAFSSPRIDQTRQSLAYLGYYGLRPALYMLKLVPRKKDPTKRTLRSNGGDYPKWLARKILLMENQIPIEAAVFSVGDGKVLRADWKRRYLSLMRRT